MFDEESLRSAAEVPGYCGPLADQRPPVSLPVLRPFVWSILLFMGGVRSHEVATSIAHLCSEDDLRCLDDETTPLENAVSAVLAEFVERGTVRLNEFGVYVLDDNPNCLRRATSICCTLDAQLPPHLLNDLAKSFLPNGAKRQGQDAAATSSASNSAKAN